ncbi:non-homologous end-joining DNA ligase [Streptomyces angustmyceticus]|uniref:ATP-dependent DNA ligase n=1 Tax=Streptomyces angustmyceticus TaxID=285578 RepID=A0A5J4L8W1_9ACTN|nr:non-homologous end-joining DNA ligase [Streptomyces angustmyceticus]UAL65725.1 non-homologous end-joining DNA ligase [Streptomyces angustmyceticus]GES27736.1 ATP-dependent DNA ligase [Streptomyces angustmyceticus]
MSPITDVEGRRVSLTNLDKVLYAETATTKGEVLHYCTTVAGPLLAQLRDRPLSFLRYPDGPEGQCFFTKNVPPGTPSWVKTCEVPHTTSGPARQVLLQDLPSLVWAANLVVELHTPQWKCQDPGIADRLVLDLDPGAPATIVECCAAARWLHDRMAADGLEAHAKTSGSKGLHLVVPIEPVPSERATAYARTLAAEAAAALPDLVVDKMTKALRPGKVFLDFSQNAAAKTTAVAYTLRARPSPTVSTPVTWDEVAGCTDPRQLAFLLDEIAPRLAEHGDLFAPLLDPGRARPLPRGKSPRAPTAPDRPGPTRGSA